MLRTRVNASWTLESDGEQTLENSLKWDYDRSVAAGERKQSAAAESDSLHRPCAVTNEDLVYYVTSCKLGRTWRWLFEKDSTGNGELVRRRLAESGHPSLILTMRITLRRRPRPILTRCISVMAIHAKIRRKCPSRPGGRCASCCRV